MRIVGGAWRGRTVDAVSGTVTRPTSDRVREAVFSIIDARFGMDDAEVLDAYAGSGALGLEALSRGAAHATFFESDSRALRTLRSNVDSLGAQDRAAIVRGRAEHLASRAHLARPVSLLLLDPPYRIDKNQVRGVIERLDERGLIAEGAIVVWEHATGEEIPWPDGVTPVTRKRYGSTEVDVAHVRAEGRDR